MRASNVLAALILAASLSLAPTCVLNSRWSFPAPGSVVTTYSFAAVLELVDPSALDLTQLELTLNGVPVVGVEGPPGVFTVQIDPGAPLRDENVLLARVPFAGAFAAVKPSTTFTYAPPGKARAFEITDPADLLTGPLAHNRVGDFMLTNDTARFVVQGPNRRDLHSVGQYGGNLIDAELVAAPGTDNFFEMAPSVNVETVINATRVTILNDGQDGTAAIVESCGPDDLIDYINASSQVASLGVELPPGIDDVDHEVEGCTQFVLEPQQPGEPGNRLGITTTIFNNGTETIDLFPGDYINGMGELEQFTKLDPGNAVFFDAGIGELTATAGIASFAYFGFGEATGVSYGRVGLPVPGIVQPDSSFSVSGVSFVLTANSIPNLFIPGPDPPTLSIPTGESRSYSRIFVVGSGSASEVLDVEAEVLGVATGIIEGCVTVGGAPAPGARVSAGPVSGGILVDLLTTFVTDAAGCYRGTLPVGDHGIAAAREGTPYEGGGATPVVHAISIADGATVQQDIALPATGRVSVTVTNGTGPVPARVTVVGFDPSPEPRITFNFLGFFVDDGGTFKDVTKDPLPFGITAAHYTGADGSVAFDVEPGSYRVFVSRGTEYSLFEQDVTLAAGATENVAATVVRVLDTPGFVSSDFHIHSINSPDSRINLTNRAEQLAGEGVENFVATDHDARTDPDGIIAALGLGGWLAGTVGEEITTFDTGHYNAYPLGLDPVRPSGGSTDWARPAPPGRDFPQYGAFTRSPAEIHQAVLDQTDSQGAPLNTSPFVAVQINHINSHFQPLKIDTSAEPPASFLDPGEPSVFRLDPSVANFFHPFPALELWNGATRGAQNEFLDGRIGTWMNLLNQGFGTTFIADTDTHTFLNLRTAGARSWTASQSDDPAAITDDAIGSAVLAGRLVGGQGLYVQTRLFETDAPANAADLTLAGNTTLTTAGDGEVTLAIDVQAPIWAPFDTVEIYANAQTFAVGSNDGVPVSFDALPLRTLVRGTDFALPPPVVVDGSVAGASRQELQLEVPFSLTEDTWFVVVVKGTDGNSAPMFPVYPSSLSTGGNQTLADLLDGNVNEGGTLALGATNALYADVDGVAGWDAPGVRLAP